MTETDYREEEASSALRQCKRSVGRTTVGFAVLAFVYVAGSLLVSLAVSLFFPHWAEQEWYTWVMSVVPLYGLAFPCLWLCIRKVPKVRLERHSLSPTNFFMLIPVSFAVMVGGNLVGQFVSLVLTRIFPFLNNSNPVGEVLQDADLLMSTVTVAVIAPVMEELLFRKLLLDRVHPMGEGISILLSGVLFGAFHGNLFQFFYATLLGMLLAFVYLKTGKIVYTMLLHMIMNLFCGILPMILMQKLNIIMPDGTIQTDNLTTEAMRAIWQYFGYVVAEYALAAVGVALVFILYKEVKNSIKPSLLTKQQQVGFAFLNPGTILMLAVCAGLFLLNLLA